MLTADLVRVTVRDREVRPTFLRKRREQHIERAAELIAVYTTHIGRPRQDVEAAVEECVGDESDVQIARGLAKLLDDRSTWDTVSPIDPVALRRMLFESAGAARRDEALVSGSFAPVRERVLGTVAAELGTTVEAVEEAMYADRKAEQRLTAFRAIEAEALVQRYDVALVQSVLLHATEVRVDVSVRRASELRAILRMVKFHQLMVRVQRKSSALWTLVLDGPVSLFQLSQRYGMQIAQFVPWLLALPAWALEADVQWGNDRTPHVLRLADSDGLVSWRTLRGTWVSREQELLEARIAERPEGWKVSREVAVEDLGGEDVLVPDLVLVHEATGRRAYVEIAGFWRKAWLQRRAVVLAEHGPPNLVVCVSKRMATETAEAQGAMEILPFAEVILWPKLRAIVERVAR